jgi:hypothetical protein
MRRFVDNLSVGNSRWFLLSAYEPYYGLSGMHSFEHSLSSSVKYDFAPYTLVLFSVYDFALI